MEERNVYKPLFLSFAILITFITNPANDHLEFLKMIVAIYTHSVIQLRTHLLRLCNT